MNRTYLIMKKTVLITCLIFLFPLTFNHYLFAQNSVVVAGGGGNGAEANGTYTYQGILLDRPYYVMGNLRIEYRNNPTYGLEWEIWNTSTEIVRYFNSSSGNTPVVAGWEPDIAVGNPTVTNLIFYTNGSSYTPPMGTPGTNNNPAGRFNLDPGANGSNLTAATVNFGGSPSGINAVKLWSSADNIFDQTSDTQLNSQSFSSSVTFSGFTSAISQTGTYYFVTLDLAAGAGDSITSTISSQTAFTVTSGSLENSFTNSPISSGAQWLPVELTSFRASAEKGIVKLIWQTATEINNYGFEIQRASRSTPGSEASGQELENIWEKIGFVKGSGNTSSVNQYSFVDDKPLPGNIRYRLKQIDNDGSFEYSETVEASFMKPYMFELAQNYPNPFNPETVIEYSLPKAAHVNLSVYNILGEQISILISDFKEAGYHSVNFLSTGLPSGTYIYKITADEFFDTKKFIIVK